MLVLSLVVAGAEPVDPVLWILFGIATVARAPVTKRLKGPSAKLAPATWSPLQRDPNFSTL